MENTNNRTRVSAPAILDPVSSPNTSVVFDDKNAPNLSRQASSDGEEAVQNNRILSPKRYTIFSSFNVRTLSPKGSFQELVSSSLSYNTDIIAVQEHRFYHPKETLKYLKCDQFQLITSSAYKNSINATIGGVGFLLSPKASSNLLNIESISERILLLELECNPRTTVICAYSPTNSSSDEDIKSFYQTLSATIDQIPLHNFVAVCGDFNAKLGPNDTPFTYNEETNRNGKYLKDLMFEFNLFSSNTTFMKPKGQLWTFEYPNGDRAQIDYILFRKKWRNSVHNSRSYSTFSSVCSDHRIVSAKTKLSLRASKPCKPHPMKQIDWRLVAEDSELCNRYIVEVNNRFSSLYTSEITSDNVEEAYNHLIKVNEDTALSILPKKRKRSKNIPNSITKARNELKLASSDYHSRPTRNRKAKLDQAKKALDEAYLNAEVAYISGKIDALSKQHAHKQYHLAWKTVKEISGKNSVSSVQIKGGSAKKRQENWISHFKNLLGRAPRLPDSAALPCVRISDELGIDTSLFTISELRSATKQLSASKAFGPDCIPPIIWKSQVFENLLLNLCNFCFTENKCPSSWLCSQIIPFPKKGDLSLPTNYRGISLMPIAAKIYNKLLLNRLIPFVDPLLRDNQNGFRSGRSTISQILSLRRLIEESELCKLDLSLVFVDFSKAFDSVDRTKIFEILDLYGIPEKIVSAIKVLYTNSHSKILTPDGETPSFDTITGILQGDTLAPFLFIVVVDYVLRVSVDTKNSEGVQLTPKLSARHPSKQLTDTDFADDLALVSRSIKGAQTLLSALESASNCVGLYLNELKTEQMTLDYSNQDNLSIKTLNNTTLKRVNDYKYLGSFISSSEKDFQVRKGLAWAACNQLHSLWSSNISDSIKLKTFHTVIEPILLYGSETWTLSKQLEKKLDGTYTRLLMRVRNLSWKNHPTLFQIYGRTPRVSDVVRKRRTQFAGHCFRAEKEIISSLLLWKPPNTILRGRKLSFPDILSRDSGIEKQDLGTAMRDRDVWRGIVEAMISTAVDT